MFVNIGVFMLQNINIKPNVSINRNNDSEIAKNIIDILFASINENLKNDRKMNAFMRGMISNSLPGIRDGSKNFVNDMNVVSIKRLLDDIQNQLRNR